MDRGLKDFFHNIDIGFPNVSILILMDRGLKEDVKKIFELRKKEVSILILMDRGLKVISPFIFA